MHRIDFFAKPLGESHEGTCASRFSSGNKDGCTVWEEKRETLAPSSLGPDWRHRVRRHSITRYNTQILSLIEDRYWFSEADARTMQKLHAHLLLPPFLRPRLCSDSVLIWNATLPEYLRLFSAASVVAMRSLWSLSDMYDISPGSYI